MLTLTVFRYPRRYAPIAVLFAAVLTLPSCVLPAPLPQIDLPAPFEDQGVQISVDGLFKLGQTYTGLTGTAHNVSSSDYTTCAISFDVIDTDGSKVADAFASTQGLRSGQTWRFQALFTSPFGTTFSSIQSGQVIVVKTVEDLLADMGNAMNLDPAGAASSPNAADSKTRTMGIVCERKLPNGSYLPRISQVVPGSLADKSGWQVGDLITAIDGVSVSSLTEVVLTTQRGSRKKIYTLQRGEDLIESIIAFSF